jgi:hypothetical protein
MFSSLDCSNSDLSSNNIVGGIRSTSFFRHRLMTSFDVSNNRLEGIADILISPSIILANFSHNSFSTIGRILKSRMAYNSIETIDISHNFVQQEANDFFMAFPPNMKRIIVRNNELAGTLPMQLPEFIKMEVFDASENYLTGYLVSVPNCNCHQNLSTLLTSEHSQTFQGVCLECKKYSLRGRKIQRLVD